MRARALGAVREWCAGAGLMEIDTACLQISPGNDAHIGAFATAYAVAGGPPHPLYLHTSPEFACKKLLAAGESAIYTLGHVFRNGERSALHHPEFTLLEWYRAGAPTRLLIEECAAVARVVARAAGAGMLAFRGREADPALRVETVTVSEAFGRHAGLDLMPLLDDRDAFAAAVTGLGLRVSDDDGWSDLFSKVLADRIEPRLGMGQLTALIDYPLAEAALAKPCAHDARLADRFEIYACGVELANGFAELTDAREQRRRFDAAMNERARLYGERFPIDEDFLACLPHMPEAGGVALGFDRLLMLATGSARIDDVLWTPLPAMAGAV